jgi:hypothetical protein
MRHPTAFVLAGNFEQVDSALRRDFLRAATQWADAVARYADAVLAPTSAAASFQPPGRLGCEG